MSKKLDRRTFLRGIGGTALALPTLECMLDVWGEPVQAAGTSSQGPHRYLVTFGGMSIGAHEDAPSDGDPASKTFIPKTTGEDYEVTTGLEPLGETVELPSGREVPLKEYVSVVSNLLIPTPSGAGTDDIPPGGRPDKFHGKQLASLLCATHFRDGDDYYRQYYNGTSSDQIVAREWGEDRTMALRAQYRYYSSGNPTAVGRRRTTLSNVLHSDGSFEQILPTINPGTAFKNLFQANDAQGGAEKSRAELLREARKGSMLDLVQDSYKRLRKKVGPADRQRLDKHAQELRELEKRIESLEESAACSKPEAPSRGWDEDSWDPWQGGADTSGGKGVWAYNDEKKRAELLGDIIYHGFKCGVSNVATLCLTLEQSFMSCTKLCGLAEDIHATGHKHGDADDVQQVARWHIDAWSRILERLAETPESPGSGETMLDNTAAVLLFEGGYGDNYEKDESSSYFSWSTHSTQNMSVLVGGGAGGLKGNVHVETEEDHPATVLMSAMEAVGVRKESFGELDWQVQPKLFGSRG